MGVNGRKEIDWFSFFWCIMWSVRVWLFLLGILWVGKSLRWVWICLHNFFGIMWPKIYSNSFFRLFHRNKPWKLFNTYQGFLQLFSNWQPWFACSGICLHNFLASCGQNFTQTLFSDSSTGINPENCLTLIRVFYNYFLTDNPDLHAVYYYRLWLFWHCFCSSS